MIPPPIDPTSRLLTKSLNCFSTAGTLSHGKLCWASDQNSPLVIEVKTPCIDLIPVET